MSYTIGKCRPPLINKYGFNELEPGKESTVTGEYRLVRIAANGYSKRNKMKIIAINVGPVNEFSSHCKILIKRIK